MRDTTMGELTTQVLVVGGGTGGCAAAIAAASLGKRVIMTEETDWIGGQLTSQMVPSDEHPWIESHGCTRLYRQFRNRLRDYYRQHYPLRAEVRMAPVFVPGGGSVSRISSEPRAALASIESLLAYYRAIGRVRVMLRTKPIAADVEGDTVRSVTVRNLESGHDTTIAAPFILDATELGDLLPLAKVEYVSGAESKQQTGEPHALEGEADADDVQAITWCFAMGHNETRGANHVIDKPEQYDFWQSYVPDMTPAWSGKLLAWTTTHPITLEPSPRVLLDHERTAADRGSLMWYRKMVEPAHYEANAGAVPATIVNWPQNDYWLGNIIDKPEAEVAKHLHSAKQLSLSLLYWMQTEAPRRDGGMGYPGLFLHYDAAGTEDGLAKYPYIRESRRIKAMFTVTENHVGTDALGGRRNDRPTDEQRANDPVQGRTTSLATDFADSVGVGCYRIDLHPSTGKRNYVDIGSEPFQIPLGALIPQRVTNLLPACKNIGTTHITNGCYRLHPVEWNIGEAAGYLAAFCIDNDVQPRGVYEDKQRLGAFQRLLDEQGVERTWPMHHGV